jgi:hypothetical protein
VVAYDFGKRDRVNIEDFGCKNPMRCCCRMVSLSIPMRFRFTKGIHARPVRPCGSRPVKLFSTHLDRVSESYSPATFVSVAKDNPDLGRAGTSYVERKNGTLGQWCKRLTRLTYAFSKSWNGLRAPLLLRFLHDSFCRVHSALRITPAMAAGSRITYGNLPNCWRSGGMHRKIACSDDGDQTIIKAQCSEV